MLLPDFGKGGKLRKVKAVTKIGRLFIRMRGEHSLRENENLTTINRETWRSVEVGRFIPSRTIVLAAANHPKAPAMEVLQAAVDEDLKVRWREPPDDGRRARNASASRA